MKFIKLPTGTYHKDTLIDGFFIANTYIPTDNGSGPDQWTPKIISLSVGKPTADALSEPFIDPADAQLFLDKFIERYTAALNTPSCSIIYCNYITAQIMKNLEFDKSQKTARDSFVQPASQGVRIVDPSTGKVVG